VPPEITPPVPLQQAQERQLCKYSHFTLRMAVPPVAEPGIYGKVGPPKAVYCWRVFALSFGDLDPAGISPDFIVVHRGPRTERHEDPWIHSVVDFPYPLTETLLGGEHHEFWLVNKTGVSQTFDITMHFMLFRVEADWNEYRAMVEVLPRMLALRREWRRQVAGWLRRIYGAVEGIVIRVVRVNP